MSLFVCRPNLIFSPHKHKLSQTTRKLTYLSTESSKMAAARRRINDICQYNDEISAEGEDGGLSSLVTTPSKQHRSTLNAITEEGGPSNHSFHGDQLVVEAQLPPKLGIGGIPLAEKSVTLTVDLDDQKAFVDQATGEVICMRNMRRQFINEDDTIKNIDLYIQSRQDGVIRPVLRMSRRHYYGCLDCFKIFAYDTPCHEEQTPTFKIVGADGRGTCFYQYAWFEQSLCGAHNYSLTKYNCHNQKEPLPSLIATNKKIRRIMVLSMPLCFLPFYCGAKFHLVFTHPDYPETPLIEIDQRSRTIHIAAGMDILEAICLYCAFEVNTNRFY